MTSTKETGLDGSAEPKASRAAPEFLNIFGALQSRLRGGRMRAVLPSGRAVVLGVGDGGVQATLVVERWRALRRLAVGGDIGFAEAYIDGDLTTPDLVAVLRLAARNRDVLSGVVRASPILRWLERLRHFLRRNSRSGSRRNIVAHYDLGNDFYRLFLDETMTYSSAVFESPDQSLADAQRNKHRRMAEGAGLRPGMHILEIGSGWGGFAIYAAGELGCRVTSVTISKAQRDLAVERVRAAGLADLVDIQLRDYREIEGTYDAIVSIEMLEAVGAEYYEAFFSACDRALKPGGRLSLQTIAFPDVAYERQRRGANWIQLYIFPGGLLPSLSVIERSLHGTRLLLSGVADIAPSYVRTLQEWRTRFMANLDTVREQGFDERFIRMWEYYLAISEAGFATGLTQDFQLVLEKRRGLKA